MIDNLHRIDFLTLVLALFGAGTFLMGCTDDTWSVNPDDSTTVPYEILGSYSYNPGEFAEYAYGNPDPVFPSIAQDLFKGWVSVVKTQNMALGKKLAFEAGSELAMWGYERQVLAYWSEDVNGNPIKLSEVLIYPVGVGWTHKIKKLLLSSHITITNDAFRPSSDRVGDIFCGTVVHDVAFISPDLEGYGISKDRVHPALNHPVVARQSVDGALAAVAFLKERGALSDGNYDMVNVGYSLGGSHALAIHKYIENDCTVEEKEQLRLSKSICGGGAYSPLVSINWYTQQETLSYPTAIPLILLSAKASSSEELKEVKLEDFFSDAFLSSGALDMITSKKYSTERINETILSKVGASPSDILSPELLDPSSPIRKAVENAVRGWDLTSGWYPLNQVVLYHSPEDDYVPYANAVLAKSGLGKGDIQLIDMPLPAFAVPHVLTGAVWLVDMLLRGDF